MSFLARIKLKARPAQGARDKSEDRSIDHLSRMARERPGDWTVRNDLADALAQAGRLDEAVTLLCSIADQLADDGFTAKSLGVYKKAVRLQPHNEYALHRLRELTTERLSQSTIRLNGAIPGIPVVEPPNAEASGPPQDDSMLNQDHAPEQMTADANEHAMPAPSTADAIVAVDPIAAEAEGGDHYDAEPERAEADAALAVDLIAEPSLAATQEDMRVDPIEGYTDAAPQQAPAHQEAPEENAPKSVEETLRDAEEAAWAGSVDTAIDLLKSCSRRYPDRLEPVAMLAHVAQTAGAEETLVDAQARLCDLYCRTEDYASARRIAESLATRYPDNARHHARLEFIVGVLAEMNVDPAPIGDAMEAVEAQACEDADTPQIETAAGRLPDEDVVEAAVTEEIAFDEVAMLVDESRVSTPAGGSECDPDDITEVEFARALTVATMGDADSDSGTMADAREVLTRAASIPRYRLMAARQLSQLDMEAGDFNSALGWLEWAFGGVLAPHDEVDLAYEMGLVLDRAGESERALGVFQEVFAKAGPGYRDVAARASQLSAADQFREASREHSVAC